MSRPHRRAANALTFVDARSNTLLPGSVGCCMETYVYDCNGNTTVYTYDALNRMLTETVTVDDVVLTTIHAYTKNGQKLSDSSTTLTVTNQYDAHGRLHTRDITRSHDSNPEFFH